MNPPEQDTIRLDQFLKLSGCAETGGEAKLLIQAGEVTVNGELETRRRKKLVPGDRVICRGEEVVVLSDTDAPPNESLDGSGVEGVAGDDAASA